MQWVYGVIKSKLKQLFTKLINCKTLSNRQKNHSWTLTYNQIIFCLFTDKVRKNLSLHSCQFPEYEIKINSITNFYYLDIHCVNKKYFVFPIIILLFTYTDIKRLNHLYKWITLLTILESSTNPIVDYVVEAVTRRSRLKPLQQRHHNLINRSSLHNKLD